MIVYCHKCKDYTLDNPRHACSWCEAKFTDKNLEKAREDERVGKNRRAPTKRP
jgi:hypothetical protein